MPELPAERSTARPAGAARASSACAGEAARPAELRGRRAAPPGVLFAAGRCWCGRGGQGKAGTRLVGFASSCQTRGTVREVGIGPGWRACGPWAVRAVCPSPSRALRDVKERVGLFYGCIKDARREDLIDM